MKISSLGPCLKLRMLEYPFTSIWSPCILKIKVFLLEVVKWMFQHELEKFAWVVNKSLVLQYLVSRSDGL
jgi:hypothetical protein